MKLLKNAKENPNTTKKGGLYSIATVAVGITVMFLSKKNPEMAAMIQGNEAGIISGIVAFGTIIAGYFANKKDK